jgi:hypothetical protein
MKILVHHCIAQEVIVYGLMEPSSDIKCRCRKRITLKRATELVRVGEASWITATRVRGERPEVCRLCKADNAVAKCALCGGKGMTLEPYMEDTPGSDILLVSRNPQDAKEKKSFFLKAKTPRAPTIEEGHITRALDDKEAKERIEQYGESIVWNLQGLGAQVTLNGKEIFPGKPEPKNDAKKGLGRDYDWGRCI